MNNHFSQLRRYAKEHHIPIISQNTESFLKKYITDHNIQHVIEIGSAIWYSTSVLKSAINTHHHKGSIISREISYPHYYQAIQNTSNYKEITLLLGNFCSYPIEKYLNNGNYDMVFIDGRKSETLQYLKLLAPYLQTTTHIIIDDVIKFKSKMEDCYNFLDKNNIHYTVNQLDEDDGVLLIPQSEHLITVLSSQ